MGREQEGDYKMGGGWGGERSTAEGKRKFRTLKLGKERKGFLQSPAYTGHTVVAADPGVRRYENVCSCPELVCRTQTNQQVRLHPSPAPPPPLIKAEKVDRLGSKVKL